MTAARVGRTIDVIIDEVDDEGAIGRSKWDAPEIDGSVFLNGATGVKPGDIVQARVTNADEYDVWAELDAPRNRRARSCADQVPSSAEYCRLEYQAHVSQKPTLTAWGRLLVCAAIEPSKTISGKHSFHTIRPCVRSPALP